MVAVVMFGVVCSRQVNGQDSSGPGTTGTKTKIETVTSHPAK
jgi:hypothetical protein